VGGGGEKTKIILKDLQVSGEGKEKKAVTEISASGRPDSFTKGDGRKRNGENGKKPGVLTNIVCLWWFLIRSIWGEKKGSNTILKSILTRACG